MGTRGQTDSSIIDDCSNRSGISPRWSSNSSTINAKKVRSWRPDSSNGVSEEPGAVHVDAIVTAARGWFDEDPGLFEYRGARLLTGVYPGFSDRLDARTRFVRWAVFQFAPPAGPDTVPPGSSLVCGQAPAHCTSNRTGSLAQFRARDRPRRPRLSGARWR